MSSVEGAIVLKNIRRDIPALKPLAANVILLQRQLIEAVQRYQEYNLRPDRDEAQLQEMLHEISVINKSQREQLERVREAEMTYVPLDDDKSFGSDSISGEALDDCEENGHFKSSDSDASSNSIVCSDGEDTLDHRLLPSSHETISQEEIITEEASVKSVPAETVMEVVEEEEEPMDWYDLSRENWSDADKLLQKIEKTGSKTVQQDFMSSIELVHVNQYKTAEEALARRKAKVTQGKKVLTTGPWQIIDIPTKISNRRCNYLTGLHITVRQKDPKRSAATTSLECFNERVKTRHHESRGSSRTSSRASSPISSQADSYHNSRDGYHRPNHNSNGNTKLLRSTKSRAPIKVKRPPTSSPSQTFNSTNNKASNNQSSKTSSSATITSAVATTTTAVETAGADSAVPLEPCVTYTMVDGVPHFQVYFPPSKDSKEQQQTTTTAATATSTTIQNKSNSPRASIVESDIESYRTNGNSSSSSSSKVKSSSSGKSAKRPRLIQSTASSSSVIKTAGSPSGPTGATTTTTSSNNSPSPSSSMTPPTSAGKEDLGLCIEKCGTWMGSPHFKTHRTLPSVHSTVASSVAAYWSPSSSVTTTIKPITSTPVPKLTSPITTAKLASPNSAKPPPPMPKLTMGNNQALKQQQQQFATPPPPIIQLQTNGGNKFIPIAPKMMGNSAMAVPNIVIVPFADKNSQSALSNNNQPSLGKRGNAPISLLKSTYPQLSISTAPSSSCSSSPSGGYLTVKTLKETQQQQQHYKQEVQSSSTNQQRMQSQQDDNHVEIKRKVVKLFPSSGNGGGGGGNGHKDQEDASQQHLAPPTVIVADMSM